MIIMEHKNIKRILNNKGKSIITVVIVAVIGIIIITAAFCAAFHIDSKSHQVVNTKNNETYTLYSGFGTNSRLSQIDNDLCYDIYTNIVYITFQTGVGRSAVGYMSPYYSENGKLCRYVDGELIELE